jgi:hypothetical protein
MTQNVAAAANIAIEKRITSAVDSVVQQMAAVFDEIAGAVIGRNTTTYLVINSSFLYRERQAVKTIQSSRRLVTRLAATGKRIRADAVFVVDDLALKSHFKILSQSEARYLIPLTDAVASELTDMSDLIFILIGAMKGLRPGAQEVEKGRVKELRLIPTLQGPVIQRIERGVYGIQKIIPPEDLLAFISGDFEEHGEMPTDEKRAVAEAYDRMTDSATTDVLVPTGTIERPSETVLGKIVESLQEQANEYDEALKSLDRAPDDPHVLNEVLRLAYNFSSDVLPLIFGARLGRTGACTEPLHHFPGRLLAERRRLRSIDQLCRRLGTKRFIIYCRSIQLSKWICRIWTSALTRFGCLRLMERKKEASVSEIRSWRMFWLSFPGPNCAPYLHHFGIRMPAS